MLTDAQYDAAIAEATRIGGEHGRNAAEWWEQDVIGGRTTGDPKPTARRVLDGMRNGDPMILDSLPRPDLSGEWADGYTPANLVEDIEFKLDRAHEPDFDKYEDCTDDLCQAYEDVFIEVVWDRLIELMSDVLELCPVCGQPDNCGDCDHTPEERSDMRIYDNGGESFDRYTVVFQHGYPPLGIGDTGNVPNGFCMTVDAMEGPHLGERVTFDSLPTVVQKAIRDYLREE
jgi:hypothetical protein